LSLHWKKPVEEETARRDKDKKDIGGTMPEDLAPEPSIKPLLGAKNRRKKKVLSQTHEDDTITGTSPQDMLWE
jgi:hypothetical protein